MRDQYTNAQEFQSCIREGDCPFCRALIRLIDEAGARLQFSPSRAGRLCEYAVIAAAGRQGMSEEDVVKARREYAEHLRIGLDGPTQDADHPIHIGWACRPDRPVNLGTAEARHENGRYYLTW